MSPEAQRIAIAEACGWIDIQMHAFTGDCQVPAGLIRCGLHVWRKEIPDYAHDLEAMREAEKGYLLGKDRPYYKHLRRVTRTAFRKDEFARNMDCIFATAAQRCEAFLKTIGKWEAK